MSISELLLRGSPWQVVASRVQQISPLASGAFFVTPVTDPNTFLVLQNCYGRGLPTGGEQVTAGRINVWEPAAANPIAGLTLDDFRAHYNTAPAANSAFGVQWSGELILPPFWRLELSWTKNAAVQNLTAQLDIYGIIFPMPKRPTLAGALTPTT